MKINRVFLSLALTAILAPLSVNALADYPHDSRYHEPDYYPPPPSDYHRRPDPDYCDYYARRDADRYVRPGSGALGSAATGAARGAIFGAIVGGRKGAKRGAAAGAGLGVIANGARNNRERDYAYTRAYEDCMRSFRR